MLKNFKITTKILIVILIITVVSQVITAQISFSEMLGLTDYSQKVSTNLGNSSAQKSSDALETQAKEYLQKISQKQAIISNNELTEVSRNVNSFASTLEQLYQNRENFKGDLPPLPDMTKEGTSSNLESLSAKGYAIDPNNVSTDGTEILVYDPRTYPEGYSSNVYRTNISDFMALSEEERTNLKEQKNVVSSNVLPGNLKSELELLNNISYFSKPICLNNDLMSSMYVGTESGISYRLTTYATNLRYDPRKRPWYTDAVAAKKSGNSSPVWISTYRSITGNELTTTCCKAFSDSNGNVLGVVAVDVFLSSIIEDILSLRMGDTGYTFAVDSSGKIVLHPEYEHLPTLTPLDSNIDSSYKTLLERMKNGENGFVEANIDGTNYFAAFSPILEFEPDWSIASVIKVDEVNEPALDIKSQIDSTTIETQNYINENLRHISFKFILILAILSILVVIISFILSRTITKPILQLTNKVAKIGEGDLSIKIDVGNSKDEIADLAKTFNKMTSDLKRYIADIAKTTAEKERIHSELNVAKTIQASMLPCVFPPFPKKNEFDIFAIMNPAKEVGGDFYDFFEIDKNRIAVVISDVSGKGVSAALFMVIAKTLIKNIAQGDGVSPAEAYMKVNDQLCESNAAGMFVTSFMGFFNFVTGEMEYVNAGHNFPLICRSNGNVEWLKSKVNFVLAGMNGIKYQNHKTHIYPGDVLFLYTDGVTEALNENNKLFSDKRLEDLLKSIDVKQTSLKDIIYTVRSDIKTFSGNTPQADDITMLVLQNKITTNDKDRRK